MIDMTFKTLSKRQNGTVDPSLFSLHLIEGRVIPDWKKFISSGENIMNVRIWRFHNDATLNVIL
jgi:hypothetical protein